jgi:hypothetical protein
MSKEQRGDEETAGLAGYMRDDKTIKKGGKTLCACLYPPPGGCHEGANIRDGGVHTAIKTACS